MAKLVVLNTVALPESRLRHCPRLAKLAERGWSRPLDVSLPGVTCTAQASMLTGRSAEGHGVVGNGWLYRDTREVRFWQQSNALLQAEPVYATARRRARERGRAFRSAKLFWWFNQGADVDVSVTPKPHYGASGAKAFDVLAYPLALGVRLTEKLGPFPFSTFWGPMAGLGCSRWIGQAAAETLRAEAPDLTLVYLPHLDYDTQRVGPSACDWDRLGRELDETCAPVLDAAEAIGAAVWVVNEYTHVDVRRAVCPNRALAKEGLLVARTGPFGRQLETFASRAFAVCDHQLAHVYVRDPADVTMVRHLLEKLDGVAGAYVGPERRSLGLDHARAGEIVLTSAADAWFAYPFWLDDGDAPDYARTVDIHRKPGYDPCELFFDPALRFPKLRVARRLLAKKLGFRTLFDVIPLDPSLVRGGHGLAVADRPVFVGAGVPAPPAGPLAQTALRDLMLAALELG